ncbi:gibberellin biosynthesis-related protein [Colletotrichum truncatum]|uniref:Gibberellin biosynthesis-related protein n=1 Tax=Colletotrichum truncatum TaxID=5467 RepID=A0ACC3YSA6_COLTU|nr:gibberellin biosynthesis-related protein [Colletotrichum truncatum]KAF6789814.1 gibberellin biosynthesis-related protein [Colletotrichum truncatum]
MAPSETEIASILQAMADDFRGWPLAPIMHFPDEAGLEYEDVFFPSEDGVALEGWFIPRKGSKRVIIANHPHWCNRAGLPSQLEPWNGLMPGNDFELNFIPDYKILHDAGYNVLAYDLRNHGHSGSGNNGLFGIYEWRDVVGSLKYIRSRPDTSEMSIGLFSRCAGANASFAAMRRCPEVFEGVHCMIAPQPLSPRVAFERTLEMLGIPASYMEDLERRFFMKTSYRLDQLSPVPDAKHVRLPTFLYQVHDDPATRPSDVQAMFDNIPVSEKKLHWIQGTTKRWHGYTYFQTEPDQFLDWFARFMD